MSFFTDLFTIIPKFLQDQITRHIGNLMGLPEERNGEQGLDSIDKNSPSNTGSDVNNTYYDANGNAHNAEANVRGNQRIGKQADGGVDMGPKDLEDYEK